MSRKKDRSKVSTFVLTVNNETGKLLRAQMEDPATGETSDAAGVSQDTPSRGIAHIAIPAGLALSAVILVGAASSDAAKQAVDNIKPITIVTPGEAAKVALGGGPLITPGTRHNRASKVVDSSRDEDDA